jgi:hypothetical protein
VPRAQGGVLREKEQDCCADSVAWMCVRACGANCWLPRFPLPPPPPPPPPPSLATGSVIGNVLGGLLATDLGFRIPFMVCFGLSLLVSLYLCLIPESLLVADRLPAFDWKRANSLSALKALLTLRGPPQASHWYTLFCALAFACGFFVVVSASTVMVRGTRGTGAQASAHPASPAPPLHPHPPVSPKVCQCQPRGPSTDPAVCWSVLKASRGAVHPNPTLSCPTRRSCLRRTSSTGATTWWAW